MRRRIVIGLVIVAVVAGLLYATKDMDLIGLLLRMHSSPSGGH